MLTNDMSPAIRDTVKSQEELAAYDGLMFISGIWNRKCHTSPFKSSSITPISYTAILDVVSGMPAYDAMQEAWNTLPAPSNL